MVKCCVTGTSLQIRKVQRILQKKYSEVYHKKVKEDLPEAAVHGSKRCTAAFYIKDVFIDCNQFEQVFAPGIVLKWSNGRQYNKPMLSKKGYWSHKHVENPNAKTTMLDNISCEELEPSEELEHWEMRMSGKI